MKIPNDPFIQITDEELSAIAAAKRPDRPRDDPPQGQDYPLPAAARLWYVAEYVHQSRLAKRHGKHELANSWQYRAQDLASEVAREANAALLQLVIDAMNGKHSPDPKESEMQRVLTAINQSYASRGRAPSNKELREAGLSGRAISDALELTKGRVTLTKPKRGRKPSV